MNFLKPVCVVERVETAPKIAEKDSKRKERVETAPKLAEKDSKQKEKVESAPKLAEKDIKQEVEWSEELRASYTRKQGRKIKFVGDVAVHIIPDPYLPTLKTQPVDLGSIDSKSWISLTEKEILEKAALKLPQLSIFPVSFADRNKVNSIFISTLSRTWFKTVTWNISCLVFSWRIPQLKTLRKSFLKSLPLPQTLFNQQPNQLQINPVLVFSSINHTNYFLNYFCHIIM